MITWLSNFITNIASHGSSFLSGFYGDYLGASANNLFNMIGDWLLQCIWNIISFVMLIMDMLEYIAFSFLGIGMGVNEFAQIGDRINLDVLLDTFRAILGLSIVLIIVFTIIAIVKQEWTNANSGFTQKDKKGNVIDSNPKTPFITKMLRSIMFMFIMPLLVYFMFAGVTSILNSFNTALKQVSNSTVASQVVASSTYEANKYRMYASGDQRIPIIIKAYDDSDANFDNIDEMALKIQEVEVQSNLRDVVTKLSNKSFSSFSDTIVKQNNNYYNSNSYSQMFEQFICTPEQYQVMADFVDYAQQSKITYYIKSIDDDNIEWKYVSSAVFKSNSKELTIEYVDANVVNGGNVANAANGKNDNTFSITYTPSTSITSPISDSLDAIMAMLGLNEYGDNLYNVMEREEGFTNVVTWASEKAWLKFSNGFDINNKTTWTDVDEILVYEYYRFKYNNSLRDYTLDDIKKGIEWDVKLITYQEYIGALDIYSTDRYLYVIELNKNYYIVEKSDVLTDKFGNAYYTLVSHSDENMSFLQKAYTTIEETGTTIRLKLSTNFNINDINSWTQQDQILVYEYFSDETYNNSLRKYSFNDLQTGIDLEKFLITNYDETGNQKSQETCVLVNKTYYKLNDNSTIYTGSNDLLKWLEDNVSYVYYHYRTQVNESVSGLLNLDSYVIKNSQASFNDLNINDNDDKKYENYRIKFSSNFSYSELSTWSYRDVLVFYLMINGYGDDIDYIKRYGIKGEVGKIASEYVVKLKTNANNTFDYIKISDIEKISTEGIYKLDLNTTFADNEFSSSQGDAFIYLDETTDQILSSSDATTYHFEFSDNFIAHNSSTWTIQDFILAYASQLGLIDSIENVKVTGYDALIFKDNGYTYYRFGKNTQDAYFLCLKDDENIEYFINKSLSTQSEFNSNKDILFEKTASGSYYADNICSGWFKKNNNISDYSTGFSSAENITFSGTFEASNMSTWTQADFLLYYILRTSLGENVNIQSYLNGGMGASIGYLKTSNRYGSTEITKVLKIQGSDIYINYDVFELLYKRKLASYSFIDKDPSTSIIDTTEIKYEISLSETYANASFSYKVASKSGIESFVWTNYYYYDKTAITDEILIKIVDVSDEIIKKIDKFDFDLQDISSINLRLSSFQNNNNVSNDDIKNFLQNPNSWTILDYIVINEFSKKTKNGDYDGMTFEDLCLYDNFVNIYKVDASDADGNPIVEIYLETNGSYYNLTDYVHFDSDSKVYICNDDSKIGLTVGNIGDYFKKVPFKEMTFSVNPNIKYTIEQTDYTVAYSLETNGKIIITYITPHSGMKIAYQKNLDSFDKYTIGDCTRKVSWPQKLMNDMQVLYPDLNWNTLIASGDWVDVLGDYVSANTNGLFVSEGNSSNITAIGMVLAEFFLSCVDESILGYADYEYSSLFDEDIIKSLMLSTLGEDEYTQLSMQAEIFVELFNSTFASILDDIAVDENIDIKESGNINLSVFVYKAFLATQILSSDLGEYFYTVANRVYAQYTIYESLASAAGKYAEYEKYVNGETSSIILQIGTEYYDVTSFVEQIAPSDRFSCNGSVPNKFSLETDEAKLNSIFESYELTLMSGNSKSDDSNVVCCSGSYNNLLYNIVEQERMLSELENGISVYIYIAQYKNDNYIYLKLNNNYYDITEYVDFKGYYEINTNYKEFINSSASTGENLVEKIFDSSEFLASSFATTESQSRNNPDYVMKVKYSGNYKSYSEKTVLDKIISDYVDAMKKDIIDTYRDEAYGYAKNFDNNAANYSIISNIYIIDNENAFTYATFKDLVLYENKALIVNKDATGAKEINLNVTPMFTFNLARVYNIMMNDKNNGKKYSSDMSWSDYINDGYVDYWNNELGGNNSVEDIYNKLTEVYEKVFSYLNDYYNKQYFVKNDEVLDDNPLYCYMFEVYYSIAYECKRKGEDYPTYLNVYFKYLNGDISRWNILSKEDITASSQYIPNYDSYQDSLLPAQVKCVFGFASLFNPKISYTGDLIEKTKENVANGSSIFDTIGDALGEIIDDDNYEVYSPKNLAKQSGLSGQTNALFKDYQNVFGIFDATSDIGKFFQSADLLGISYSAKMTELFVRSSNGDREAWSVILKLYKSLGNIIDEFNAIIELFTTGENQTVNSSINAGYDKKTYEKALNTMVSFYEKIQEYVLLQQKVDVTIKSCITFTLAQYGQNYTINYKFNLENRGYKFSTSASPLRLAEYTLGGSFLAKYGIYSAFTDSEFEGFVHTSKVYDSVTGIMKTKLEMWPELREFAAEIAAYTAKIYYTTSLVDLSDSIENAVEISDILIDKNNNNQTTIEYMILEYLYSSDISPQILCSLMLDGTNIANLDGVSQIITKLDNIQNGSTDDDDKLYKSDTLTLLYALKQSGFDDVHIAFKNVISYLTLSEDQKEDNLVEEVDFDNMTFSDLKLLLMNRLIDYIANPSETAEQNVNRYMTLFNLVCGNINFYDNEKLVGTNLKPVEVYEKLPSDTAAITYAGGTGNLHFAITSDDGTRSEGGEIKAEFVIDTGTKNAILELANCDNRPLETLVELEYENLYNRTDGCYDEALGDVFVICLYDEQINKYVPFMAKNPNVSANEDFNDYVDNYHHYIDTEYYAQSGRAYPIIAKGIITSNGLPTAIRIVDGEVMFYRTNVTATTDIGESAILNSALSSEITTIGYTTYVPATFYLPFGDTGKMVEFTGNVNMGTVLKSDIKVYFLQSSIVYRLGSSDEYGGFSVLDNMAMHYQLGGMSIFLMFMGFVVLIPLMFKLSLSAMRRILDLIFLCLIYPLCAAMTPLKDISKNWNDMMKKALLSVFGYIIGFNSYYILVSSVLKIDFVDASTLENIKAIGGFEFISLPTLNMLVRSLFIIEAVAIIKGVMDLLLPMVTGGAATNSTASAVDGKDVMKEMKSVVDETKSAIKKVESIYSGKFISEAKDAAIEYMKTMIPGSAIAGAIKEDVQDIAAKHKSKAIKKKAIESGLSPAVADSYAKQYYANQKEQRNKKREMHINNANAFMQTYASDFNKYKFEKPSPTLRATLKEKFGPSAKKSKKDSGAKAPKKDKKSKK